MKSSSSSLQKKKRREQSLSDLQAIDESSPSFSEHNEERGTPENTLNLNRSGGSDSPSLAHWRSTKFNKSNKSTKSTKSSGRSDEDGSGAGASSSREISLRLNPTYVKKHKIKLLTSARSTKSSVVELSAKGLSSPDNDSLRLEVGVAQESDRGIFGGMFGSDRDRECTPCAPWFPSQLLKRGSDGGPDSIPSQNSSASAIHLEPLSRDATLYEREANKMPPKRTKWWQVTLYIINDTIGAWLILFSSISLALYGWVLGMLILVFLWPLNLYTAHLLWRCRNVFPGAISIGDLVFYLTRSTIAMYITFFFVNATILLTLASQMDTAAANIYWFFSDTDTNASSYNQKCFVVFLVAVAFLGILPLTQMRYLHSLTLMNIVNITCMLIFVIVSIYMLASGGRLENATTSVGPNQEALRKSIDYNNLDQSGAARLLGIDILISAYYYQLIILEIIAEMKHTKEFPKANYWATPVVLFVAVACASSQYFLQGEDEELKDQSPSQVLTSIFNHKGTGRSAVAYIGVICFTVHMIGCCVIRSVVLTRSFHLLINPRVANQQTWRSRIEWAGVSVGVVAVAWTLNLFIRNLGLMGLVQGTFALLTSIVLPICLYLVLSKKRKMIRRIVPFEWVVIVFILVLAAGVIVIYAVQLAQGIQSGAYNQNTMEDIRNMCDCKGFPSNVTTG